MLAPEEAGKGTIKHVERSRQAAKGGHHQPCAIRRKARASHRAATLYDPRTGMKMPGDLAFVLARRHVPKHEIAKREFVHALPRQTFWRCGIVVSRNPEPLSPRHQCEQFLPVDLGHAG